MDLCAVFIRTHYAEDEIIIKWGRSKRLHFKNWKFYRKNMATYFFCWERFQTNDAKKDFIRHFSGERRLLLIAGITLLKIDDGEIKGGPLGHKFQHVLH